MAKKKTRQQKIIADLHRRLLMTKTESIKTTPSPQSETTNIKHLTYTNPYLVKDLKKTAMLTAGIVLGQLFLFFLLKQHLLVLPGISY